jgi:quercetin dioxygenase-like cupin family protein
LERPHDEAVDGERHEQRLSVSALGYAFSVQRWDLLDLEAPEGTRDPIVLHSDDGARSILIVLRPGQSLGEHQVKENAWITVLEGAVEISAGAETIAVGRGTLMRFEPDERHSLRSDAGARVLMLLAPWPGAGHYRGSD